MSEKYQITRKQLESALNSVEYLALRADDIGEANAVFADQLRAILAEPPLITCLHENGDLIAAQATIAHQAQMIEHLRGGLTSGYTAVDMTTAAAQGFRDGVASVVVELPEVPTASFDPLFAFAYAQKCREAIIAAGGRVKE